MFAEKGNIVRGYLRVPLKGYYKDPSKGVYKGCICHCLVLSYGRVNGFWPGFKDVGMGIWSGGLASASHTVIHTLIYYRGLNN